MNLRSRRADEPEIGLTPLIDIVFLLLIFFMVSTSFRSESALEISLPEATSAVTSLPEDFLEILIDADGSYAINGDPVTGGDLGALAEALSARVVDPDRVALVIRADAETPHQAVVRAMDASSRIGVKRLSIATISAPANEEGSSAP